MSQTQRQPPAWPAIRRINWRVVLFFGVAAVVLGFPIYIYLAATVTGGITHSRDRRGDLLEVDLKAMSSFEMSQTSATLDDIPKRFRELDGKRVVLFGEMYAPYYSDAQIPDFQLCYSIAKCCVSPQPKVQHFVKSTAPSGQKVNYYSGVVKVVGTLHVRIQQSAGRISSIYQLDVEHVEPG